jgi:NADH:ubiquinone oxidoreductase subunit K
MSVAGEACSVVEDAIAVMARERSNGQGFCAVVYREFTTVSVDDLNPLMDDELLAESAEKDDI